jgi:hypothetical protein
MSNFNNYYFIPVTVFRGRARSNRLHGYYFICESESGYTSDDDLEAEKIESEIYDLYDIVLSQLQDALLRGNANDIRSLVISYRFYGDSTELASFFVKTYCNFQNLGNFDFCDRHLGCEGYKQLLEVFSDPSLPYFTSLRQLSIGYNSCDDDELGIVIRALPYLGLTKLSIYTITVPVSKVNLRLLANTLINYTRVPSVQRIGSLIGSGAMRELSRFLSGTTLEELHWPRAQSYEEGTLLEHLLPFKDYTCMLFLV